jgi:hypothetical protein
MRGWIGTLSRSAPTPVRKAALLLNPVLIPYHKGLVEKSREKRRILAGGKEASEEPLRP